MGRNKKNRNPIADFFKMGKGDTKEKFAPLTVGLVQSEAYRALNNRQRVLYHHMQLQFYTLNMDSKRFIREAVSKEEWAEYQKANYFVFNWAMVKKGGGGVYDGLYSNQRTFYGDIVKLAEVGLIEVELNNKLIHKKNLYKFSTKWKKYAPGMCFYKPPNKR